MADKQFNIVPVAEFVGFEKTVDSKERSDEEGDSCRQAGQHLSQKSELEIKKIIIVPVAQLDRASDCGSEGRRFESSRVHRVKLG